MGKLWEGHNRGPRSLVLMVAVSAAACGAHGDLSDDALAGPVARVTDVIQVAAGQSHACALHASGAVECWGASPEGEIGNPEAPVVTPIPFHVAELNDAVQLSVGLEHTCALTREHTVVCWGSDASGQLGDGEWEPLGTEVGEYRVLPAPVVDLEGAIQVSAGTNHACAVLQSGEVACWGSPMTSSTDTRRAVHGSVRPSPEVIEGVSDVVGISAGNGFTCAVQGSGAVSCWGKNDLGQLGDGTNEARSTPAAVHGIDDARAVAAGTSHACAIRNSSDLACWGNNSTGHLGDGTTDGRLEPVRVSGLWNVASVSAGAETCAVLDDGEALCWGENSSGRLGDGTEDDHHRPVGVKGLNDALQLAVGSTFACGLRTNGAVVCMGANFYGQLGDGTTEGSLVPVGVIGMP